MSFPTYTLDGTADYHEGTDYDDADFYDLEDDTTDRRLEEIIRRHHGERLVITIQVLGPPRTLRDHLRRCAGELNRQMDMSIWLARWKSHLEYLRDKMVRDVSIRARLGVDDDLRLL